MSKEYLPGSPSGKMIRHVRGTLRLFGIRPRPRTWAATWDWAYKIAASYAWTGKLHWPSFSEIAAQYVALLAAEMKSSGYLRLPYRSMQQMPESVASIFAAAAQVKPRLLAGQEPPLQLTVVDDNQESLVG